MPIKDGYEACEMIIRQYENLNSASRSNSENLKDWLNDLQKVFNVWNECDDINDKEQLLVTFK